MDLNDDVLFCRNGHRYMFQNQEADNEFKGFGNSYNYKYRMHDPRLGRFFAVDPITMLYPEVTPYQFALNSVIANRELEGLQGYLSTIPDKTFFGVSISLTLGNSKSVKENLSVSAGLKTSFLSYKGIKSDNKLIDGAFGTTLGMKANSTIRFYPDFVVKEKIEFTIKYVLLDYSFDSKITISDDGNKIKISTPNAKADKNFRESFKNDKGSIPPSSFSNQISKTKDPVIISKTKDPVIKGALSAGKDFKEATKSVKESKSPKLLTSDELSKKMEYWREEEYKEKSKENPFRSTNESFFDQFLNEGMDKSLLEWRQTLKTNHTLNPFQFSKKQKPVVKPSF